MKNPCEALRPQSWALLEQRPQAGCGVKRRGDQRRDWRRHCGGDRRQTRLAAWSRVARRWEQRGLVASLSRVFSGLGWPDGASPMAPTCFAAPPCTVPPTMGGGCCLLSMPIFPRGPIRVCQAAVVRKEVWLVEPRGLGACLGPDQTAAGQPLVAGLCSWKPLGEGTASYLESAVRYCLAWRRKTRVNFCPPAGAQGCPWSPLLGSCTQEPES